MLKLIKEIKEKHFVFFIVLLALAVGSFWVARGWSHPLESDEVAYYQLGQKLCQLKKFVDPNHPQWPTMSRPPLYPFLVSLFDCSGLDNPNLLRVFQIFLLGGIVLLIYFQTKLIFGPRVGQGAALLTALFPPLGFLTSQLHSEITFIFLSLAATLFLILFFKEAKAGWAAWSGLFFGLASLTRPIFFLFPVFLIAALFFLTKYRAAKSELLKKSLILLLFFALVLSPWLIRNYLVFKEINISDVAGLTFYGRAYQVHYFTSQEIKNYILLSFLGSYLTKKINPDYDYSFSKFEPHVFRRSSDWPSRFGPEWPSGLTQHQERKKLFQEAKQLIYQHPIKYLGFSFLEFFRIHRPLLIEFGATDLFAGTHPEIPDWLKISIIVFIKLIYLIFFIIVFYGIIISWPQNKLARPVIIMVVYVILLLCSMGTIPRYAIPLYPFYFSFFSFAALKL